MIELIDGVFAGAAVPDSGGAEINNQDITITPSTSAQTFTASAPYTGYGTIDVSAVTASIDNNIQSQNIVSGVSILGVNGSATELNGTALSVTPSTSAQSITPTSPNNGFTEVSVSAVTSSIDANIQAGNIKDGVQILGVTGSYSGTAPTGTLNVTLNGVYDVTNYANVDVDVPAGADTKYGAAVDTFLGDVDANGVLQSPTGSYDINLTGVKDFALTFEYKFYGYKSLNSFTAPDVEIISQGNSGVGIQTSVLFSYAFAASSLKSVSFPKLLKGGVFSNAFQYSDLNSLNFPKLLEIPSMSSACENSKVATVEFPELRLIANNCGSMFSGVSTLTSASFPKLTVISSSISNMFSYCNNLTSVTFPKLQVISASNALQYTFRNTKITELSFPALLPDFNQLYWSSYQSSAYTNQFNQMLAGRSNVTVHFPSDLQAVIGSWSDVTNGFGGTNTTVLFDLSPASVENDYVVDENGALLGYYISPAPIVLDNVKTVKYEALREAYSKGYIKTTTSFSMPDLEVINGNYSLYQCLYKNANLTSFSAPNLTSVSGYYALGSMLSNCTSLTSIDLSSLTSVSGSYVCDYMFNSCTSLTSIDTDFITDVVSGEDGKYNNMFAGCSGLTSISLPNLTSVNASSALNYMFKNCTSLASVDVSNLTEILNSSPYGGFYYTFQNCTSLTSISFTSLTSLVNSNVFNWSFSGCTALADVYFPALTTTSFGNDSYKYQLQNLLGGTGTNTVKTLHFPSNLSSTIQSLQGYPLFGGPSNQYVTIAFDLPATS